MTTSQASLSSILSLLRAPETWTIVPGESGSSGAGPGGSKGPSVARRAWSACHTHRNRRWEIMLAVHGTGWFGLNDTFYPFQPGSLFLVDPNMPHDNFYPQKQERIEQIWFYPLGDYLMVRWMRVKNGRRVLLYKNLSVLSPDETGISLPGFPDRVRSISSPRDALRMRLMIGLAVSYLAARIEAGETDMETVSPKIRQDVVGAVCRLIDETGGKGVTLHSLGHFTGYSKYHLHRVFREKTGCTIHQYIDIARYRRMNQLKKESATNEAIADALGFSDASAYLRWRRKKHLFMPAMNSAGAVGKREEGRGRREEGRQVIGDQ